MRSILENHQSNKCPGFCESPISPQRDPPVTLLYSMGAKDLSLLIFMSAERRTEYRLHDENLLGGRTSGPDSGRTRTADLSVQFPCLARLYQFGGINRVGVDLHLDDLAILVDEIVHSAGGLVFRVIDTVLLCDVAAPIAEQRERDVNLLRPCLVREGRIHAYTQHLGIGSFQLG